MTYPIRANGTLTPHGSPAHHEAVMSTQWLYTGRKLNAIVLSGHPQTTGRVRAEFDLPGVNGRFMRVAVKGEAVWHAAGKVAIRVAGVSREARRRGE